MVVFMIVGKSEPLYEIELGKLGGEGATEDVAYLSQFILYSSLDMINNSALWSNSSTFLRVVDRFNYLQVSAYASQGGKILLLLHNGKSEDAIRTFFVEAHELYVKYLMNPFAQSDEAITSPHFSAHVRALGKKYLS